jgi:Secretion system C-terminal sorting domain
MPQQISDAETRNEEFEPCTAQLFPNPGSERVFIRYQLDCQAETGTFRIFDNTGKLIQEAVFSDKSGTYELDTEHLPGGIYPVQISTNSGYFWHEKLVLLR